MLITRLERLKTPCYWDTTISDRSNFLGDPSLRQEPTYLPMEEQQTLSTPEMQETMFSIQTEIR